MSRESSPKKSEDESFLEGFEGQKREFQELSKVKMTFVYETLTATCVFSSMNFLLNAFEVFVKKMCALKRVFLLSKSPELDLFVIFSLVEELRFSSVSLFFFKKQQRCDLSFQVQQDICSMRVLSTLCNWFKNDA